MNKEQWGCYHRNNSGKAKNFIYFVHIPRTGGTYVKDIAFKDNIRFQWYGKNAFFMLGYKLDDHPCVYEKPLVSYSDVRNQTDTYINDPYFLDIRSLVVATVRNPYDRYVAAYLEAKNSYEKYSSYTFEKFIYEVCDPEYKPDKKYGFSFELSRHFFPYQIFGDCGKCVADIVLRKELLNEGLQQLSNMLSIPFDRKGSSNAPPKLWSEKRVKYGVKKDRDYRRFYSAKTVDIVKSRRKNELSAFGYSFENNHDNIKILDPRNIEYYHKEKKLILREVSEPKPIKISTSVGKN